MESTKVVLITGCNSGFGRLTAELLARQGHSVYAGIRETHGRNAGAVKELTEWAQHEQVALSVADLDVTDDASVVATVQQIIDEAGRIDVVVNNAGMLAAGVTEAFLPQEIRQVFEVNCLGPHRVNRATLPFMRRRGAGLLILVSSVLARCTLPFHGAYCASKAAAESLAETMHDELVGTGVDVAIVEPGAYPTAIAGKIMGPADTARASEYVAAQEMQKRLADRFGEWTTGPNASHPREVAEAIERLIASSAGDRPLRTVVGRRVTETELFNSVAAQFRQRALSAMGIDAQ